MILICPLNLFFQRVQGIYYGEYVCGYITTNTHHTGCDFLFLHIIEHFLISTHAPHMGCDLSRPAAPHSHRKISTHAPHTGCDLSILMMLMMIIIFQLTHPTRGATAVSETLGCTMQFQLTHPTRGATSSSLFITELRDFNSRTPHGVRLYI